MAVVRDFSRQNNDMIKAIDVLKKHQKSFAALLELNSEILMADQRIRNLDQFFSEVDRKAITFIDLSPAFSCAVF